MSDDPPSNTDTGSSSKNGRCGGQQEEIDVDELHHLLASSRRRRLLSYLTTRADDPVPVDSVVDAVAESEQPDPGPATHRDRVVIDLQHVHLPILADHEMIDYDPVAGTVHYKGSAGLESLLATSESIEERET